MDGTSLLHVVVSLDALGCGAATPSGCRLQLVAEVSERVLTAGPQQLAGLWQVRGRKRGGGSEPCCCTSYAADASWFTAPEEHA